jgi:uncharacterized protein (DUF488 family)
MHNPQFNEDVLPEHLKTVDVSYIHMVELGGLRHAKRGSINTGWRNASFRGYADYMQTPEFEKAIGNLIQLASREQVALMCAEAVPWRCHRSLIEDALSIRGIRCEDIINVNNCRVHSLTSFAKVQGTQIIYPEENGTKTK